VPSILVQFDDATMRRLNQVAPSAKRQLTEFIRRAVKDAIRRQEFARMRAAYRRQPDSAAEADDWSSAEEFAL
jgi:predicted transcriptional regulator